MIRLIIYILSVLLICTTIDAKQYNIKRIWIKKYGAPVRKGPSNKEKIVDRCRGDTPLKPLEVKGEWFKVQLANGKIGWIHKSFLKKKNEKKESEVTNKEEETEVKKDIKENEKDMSSSDNTMELPNDDIYSIEW